MSPSGSKENSKSQKVAK